LRVGGLLAEEPYFQKDPSSGRWGGICVTMARNLAAELGVETAPIESNWADLATDLNAGKIDLAYLNPTAQRGMFADFAAPLFYDTYAVVTRKGFAPKGWAEINVPETLLAVDSGSAREEMARRFAGNAAITGFKAREEAMAAIQSGRGDCFVTTVFLGLVMLKKNPQLGDLIVPIPHLRAAVCPGMPYDADRRFRGVVQAWLEDSHGRGRIREWILADLANFGVEPGDLPPEVSF
jgi:polar amino acid transport system substrate-binding protein